MRNAIHQIQDPEPNHVKMSLGAFTLQNFGIGMALGAGGIGGGGNGPGGGPGGGGGGGGGRGDGGGGGGEEDENEFNNFAIKSKYIVKYRSKFT